jgi:hypothetical protein
VQSNYDAVQTVGDLFKEGESDLGLICEEVCFHIHINLSSNTIFNNEVTIRSHFFQFNYFLQFCDLGLSLGSKDNMTALVIKFEAQKVGSGGGVRARRQLRNAAPSDSMSEKIDC